MEFNYRVNKGLIVKNPANSIILSPSIADPAKPLTPEEKAEIKRKARIERRYLIVNIIVRSLLTVIWIGAVGVGTFFTAVAIKPSEFLAAELGVLAAMLMLFGGTIIWTAFDRK